jgi:hypothetical protein
VAASQDTKLQMLPTAGLPADYNGSASLPHSPICVWRFGRRMGTVGHLFLTGYNIWTLGRSSIIRIYTRNLLCYYSLKIDAGYLVIFRSDHVILVLKNQVQSSQNISC